MDINDPKTQNNNTGLINSRSPRKKNTHITRKEAVEINDKVEIEKRVNKLQASLI